METAIDPGKLIVIDTSIQLRDVTGQCTFYFRRGEQYVYSERVTQLEGCGCGGSSQQEATYFRVTIKNYTYLVKDALAHEDRTIMGPGAPNIDERIKETTKLSPPEGFGPYQNYQPNLVWERFQKAAKDVTDPSLRVPKNA